MASFSIECTTCGTRLSVRDRSLVGQILACPKCQGMVLVELPQDQLTVGTGNDVDSQAITSDALETDLPAPEDLQPQPLVNAFATGTEDVEEPASAQPNLPADWQASQHNPARQYALIAVIAVIALVSSVGLFGLFVRSSVSQADPPIETDDTQDPVVTFDKDPAATDSVTEQPVETPQDVATVEAATEDDPAHNTNENSKPTTEPEELDNVPVPEENQPEPPRELLGQDAVDRIFQDPQEEPAAEAEPDMLELPEGLQQFSNIFDPGIQIPNKLKSQNSNLVFRFELPVLNTHRFSAPSSPVDVGKQLSQEIGFDIRDKPLSEMIGILAETIAVPITIDLELLDAASISPESTVNGRFLDQDAQSSMANMLLPVGCRLVETAPGFLAVRADDKRIQAQVDPALSLEGLNPDAECIALIARLASSSDVPVALTWDETTNSFQDLEQLTPSQRWHVALAVDAIRLARGLPGRLPKTSSERWLSETPSAFPPPQIQAVLFEGEHAQPTSYWLRQLAKSNGASLLIDWPSVWENGLTPTASLLPWPRHDSYDSMADELLTPYGLILVDAGQGVWILTTERSRALKPQTIAFRQPIQDPQLVISRLASAAGYQEIEAFPGGIDPLSNRLICRLPHFMLVEISKVLKSKP